MDDHGLLSKPSSRPSSADRDNENEIRTMSPMSSDNGPDAQSTDLGFEKPLPPTKTTGCEDLFKKPVDPVENIALGQMGSPAMAAAGAARVNSMSWAMLLYDYSQGTTMHGLPYITRGGTALHHPRCSLRRQKVGCVFMHFSILYRPV